MPRPRRFLLSNQSRAFVPTDISGLALWLDASDASTLTLDGSNNVSQWNDKSGNDRNAVQASTIRRPSLTTVANGRTALLFDGIDDQLRSPYPNTSTTVTAFVVFTKSAAGGSFNTFCRMIGAFHGTTDASDWNTTSGFSYQWNLGASKIQFTRNSSAIAQINSSSFGRISLGAFRRSGTEISHWFNGSTATGTTGATAFASDNIAMGGQNADGWLNGYIAEIIIYNSAISDASVDTVNAYLKAKWGTP